MQDTEKVLVLRTCRADMTSYRGFKWPESGPVEAPDWQPDEECGNGLHGWLWGVGDYSLKHDDPNAKWLVVEVNASEIIDLEGKVKFPSGNVLYCGDFATAFRMVRERAPDATVSNFSSCDYGHATATGRRDHATATGESGLASTTGAYGHAITTGYYGHSITTGEFSDAVATGMCGYAITVGLYSHAAAIGDSGYAATTGNYSHAATTGYHGHATATGIDSYATAVGFYGHAAAGPDGVATVLGVGGCAKAGPNGSLILTWDDGARKRHVVGYVGEDGIEADTWYQVKDGKLVKGYIRE